MTKSQLTPKREALLKEAFEMAQLLEQKTKQLSNLGEAFAQKWKKISSN